MRNKDCFSKEIYVSTVFTQQQPVFQPLENWQSQKYHFVPSFLP